MKSESISLLILMVALTVIGVVGLVQSSNEKKIEDDQRLMVAFESGYYFGANAMGKWMVNNYNQPVYVEQDYFIRQQFTQDSINFLKTITVNK